MIKKLLIKSFKHVLNDIDQMNEDELKEFAAKWNSIILGTTLQKYNIRPWKECDLCNYDRHNCMGCGLPLNHGMTVCEECSKL